MYFSIKYQQLNDNNSEEFHASFVLELCKPLPAAVDVVHKIYEVLNKAGKKSLHFLPGKGGGGEVYSHKHWVAMYGLLPKTLTIFMT